MPSNKLAAYRAKRDFSRTSEPRGAQQMVAGPNLRFVIQKHAATRLHYDFRLEWKGVFLSWAVTRGPSLDPAQKRLAVEVEDHPLAYGDFEGTIPKGQYGGGTVMLWDRGYWAPDGDADAMLKKGDLKFVLEGEKLHGSWVLVRMHHDRKASYGKSTRTNWLLIKHRDTYAKDGDGDAVLKQDKSVASGRDLNAIAAGTGKKPTAFMRQKSFAADAIWNSRKNGEALDDGEEDGSAPKPVKSLPRFIKPQLCRLQERPAPGPGRVHEIKFDDYRIQARIERGKALLFSYVGRVGTGYGGKILSELLPRPKQQESKASPFALQSVPPHEAGVHWVKPHAGGRDRIRRFQQRGHGAPVRLQGPAPGQTGGRSGGGNAVQPENDNDKSAGC